MDESLEVPAPVEAAPVEEPAARDDETFQHGAPDAATTQNP